MKSPIRSPRLFLGCLAVLLLPTLSLAAGPRWAVSGFASLNTYLMSDINNEIMAINHATMGTGIPIMDEVNNGPSFGGGVRAIFNDRAWVGLDYERLLGSSELSVPGGRLKYDVPSHGLLASAGYLFPGSGAIRFGLGGGIGYYTTSDASVQMEASVGGVSAAVTGDIKASGIGGHAFGLLDAALSEAWHAELLAGFRFANTSDIELTVPGAGSATIDGYSLDWTGAMVRAGLALHFGPKR